MEGEVVFYDPADLERTKRPPLLEYPQMTSPLGRLYEAWNAANRRAAEEYERRKYEIWRSDRARR